MISSVFALTVPLFLLQNLIQDTTLQFQWLLKKKRLKKKKILFCSHLIDLPAAILFCGVLGVLWCFRGLAVFLFLPLIISHRGIPWWFSGCVFQSLSYV